MPLNNFGIVDRKDRGLLARSAQPDETAMVALSEFGFNIIVKLNTDAEYPDEMEDRSWIAQSGRALVLDPYPPLFEIPAREAILRTVDTLQSHVGTGDRVLVHCTHGVDRTGLVIGAYRIVACGWTFDRVEDERRAFGVTALRDIVDIKIVEFLKALAP